MTPAALTFISGALSLVATVVGLPTIILFMLQRKNANKKLDIEEDGISVTLFNAQTAAYKDLLDRSNHSLAEANERLASSLRELTLARELREELRQKLIEQGNAIAKLSISDASVTKDLDVTKKKLEALRALFEEYVTRVGVSLTVEELIALEETKPPPPNARGRKRT